MEFGVNKTPVERIKDGAFGGTYFRDIYSGINKKWYRKSWKEFDQLKDMERKKEILKEKLKKNLLFRLL